MTTSPRIDAPDTASSCPIRAFEVLGVTPRLHAARRRCEFDVHVSEPSGRQVYAIALTAQVMIEPARRAYDAETQARLEELFGPPERWASDDAQPAAGTSADALVPAFTGATTFRARVPCSYDMELAAAKYFHSLPDGEVPLGFNFNGTIHYRGDDGRLQMSLVPWSATTDYRMDGRRVAHADRAPLPEPRLARRAATTRSRRSSARRRAARCPTLDEVVAALLEERA